MKRFIEACRNRVNNFLAEQQQPTGQEVRGARRKGATVVEYAVVVALIVVVAIAGITSLGTATRDKFSSVATTVSAAGS